jgi:hypothetical protein
MKIFLDRVQAKDFGLFRRKKGQFLSRLIGFNITGRDVHIEPVYLPVLKVSREGGIAILEFSLARPLLMVVLMPVWPFVHIERVSGMQLEDE